MNEYDLVCYVLEGYVDDLKRSKWSTCSLMFDSDTPLSDFEIHYEEGEKEISIIGHCLSSISDEQAEEAVLSLIKREKKTDGVSIGIENGLKIYLVFSN